MWLGAEVLEVGRAHCISCFGNLLLLEVLEAERVHCLLAAGALWRVHDLGSQFVADMFLSFSEAGWLGISLSPVGCRKLVAYHACFWAVPRLVSVCELGALFCRVHMD